MNSVSTERALAGILDTPHVPRPDHADAQLADSYCDSDEALLNRVASGDNEALSCLFRRYAKVAHGIARRILRDPTVADDCVQDIFLYFHRKSSVFSSEKGSASSWIIQTIYHQALRYRMHLVQSSRLECPIEDQSLGIGTRAIATNCEHLLEWTIGKTKLRKMLRSLSSDQWETLRLHFFEGYTLSEIAQKKGQSLGNVRHHFYRGLEKLRRLAFRAESKDRISDGNEMSGLAVKEL
jgi:RNA polymerase sigma-70 factor (ECF subfamily)